MSLYLYFMYVEIGVAVFAGLAIFLVAIPLNVFIANKSEKYQINQMKNKDIRMKTINEVLGGITVIKLCGWESFFTTKIQNIRSNEEKDMRKFAWVDAITSLVFTMLPYLALLISFATFILMEEGNVLTAEKAFVTLSYMGQLSMQIVSLPMIIVSVIQANVSLKRLNEFMSQEEMDADAIEHALNIEEPLKIKHGSFKWRCIDALLTLEDININVPQGSLTAVVGSVGSGKSSLLSAIIGDLIKVSGYIKVGRSIAYVPQQPWLAYKFVI